MPVKNKFLKTFNIKLFVLLLIIYTITFYFFFSLSDYLILHSNNQPVGDIILSNITAVNMSFLFVFGYFIPQFLLLFYLFIKKNFNTFFYFYFLTAIVFFIRLCFNIMTHMHIPQDAIQSTYFPNLFLENDLFFSGHVAIPFLYFLIFKKLKQKYFSIIFLIITVLMAITVLLMKVHYTIDVMSAPFITFGLFYITDLFLKKILKLNIKKEYEK